MYVYMVVFVRVCLCMNDGMLVFFYGRRIYAIFVTVSSYAPLREKKIHCCSLGEKKHRYSANTY